MKNKLFLAAILIVFILTAVSALLYKQRQHEMEKTRYLEGQIEAISAERIIIAKNTKEASGKKDILQADMDKHNEKIQAIKTDISEAQLKKEDLDDKLSQKNKIVSKLEERLDLTIQQESVLTARLTDAKSDYQRTADEIESLRGEKSAMEEKIKNRIPPPKGVELKKIVVKITPPLEGNVLEVNKEYNFIIIDRGAKDNINSGDVFNIYRNGQLIAKAVAENIYEEISSIKVLDEWLDVPFLNGDTVRLIKP